MRIYRTTFCTQVVGPEANGEGWWEDCRGLLSLERCKNVTQVRLAERLQLSAALLITFPCISRGPFQPSIFDWYHSCCYGRLKDHHFRCFR